ncbi:MAG: FAD-dependent protein, partial [Ginsengibacter sp.]
MQQKVILKLSPPESSSADDIIKHIAKSTSKKLSDITGYTILKKSIDARSKNIWIILTVNAFINEPFQKKEVTSFHFRDVSNAQKKVLIIGGGPAGIFAALQLIELGIKPILIERGKDVRSRRRDLARLNKEGIINPESNYCYGEGGAGTYSDGKLYTRSTKRGNIDRILNLFVHFGAPERILSDAHPHIGTNKLPDIISAMRTQIIDCGGEFHFDKKAIGIEIKNETIHSVLTADGDVLQADSYILATGHSARDIYQLLHENNIEIHAKGFALGVRIEHPQDIINNIQYGQSNVLKLGISMDENSLPPASYSLVTQSDNRGVFSFCMCPGGIIATASTDNEELVVNGWSPSKRNNPYANSGMVVQVEPEDVVKYYLSKEIPVKANDPLLMMNFQKEIEQKAFTAGGGKFVAPAQRMVDYIQNKHSATLPKCSYLPGITSSSIGEILPNFIHHRLQNALPVFGKKLKAMDGVAGYYTNEAILVATESRTSSPVRIPRDKDLLHHPHIN